MSHPRAKASTSSPTSSRGLLSWIRKETRHTYLGLPRPCRLFVLLLGLIGAVALVVTVLALQLSLLTTLFGREEDIPDDDNAHQPGGHGEAQDTRARGLASPDEVTITYPEDLVKDAFLADQRRVWRLLPHFNTIHAANLAAQERQQYHEKGYYTRVPTETAGVAGDRIPGAFRQMSDFHIAAKRRHLAEQAAKGNGEGSPAETEMPCSAVLEEAGVCPPQRELTTAEHDGGYGNPLPNLRTAWRRYTAPELMQRHGHMDFVYAYVNGTEVNHVYRRFLIGDDTCFQHIRDYEERFWREQQSRRERHGTEAAPMPPLPQHCVERVTADFKTGRMLLEGLERRAEGETSERDRETDELRYSMRSLEKHIRWHRGRLFVVSPGHRAQWIDNAKNFLAGMCGGDEIAEQRERGTHLRLTTVHQDVIMPYGMKLTMNSHIIEQHLWRVKNMSRVHAYFNDDYFVNRDVAIMDMLNEYGGTIVRTEAFVIKSAAPADEGESWLNGVYHNNLFNALELDIRREDYLPAGLIRLWEQTLRSNETADHPADETPSAFPADVEALRQAFTARVEHNDFVTEVARSAEPESLFALTDIPLGMARKRRRRFFASHSPFLYCTNMFRHFNLRYEREFSFNAIHHRIRRSRDFFIPFLYNAFVVARPWVASPQFLPHVLTQHLAQKHVGADRPEDRFDGNGPGGDDSVSPNSPLEATIYLDNNDGCAPATLYYLQGDSHVQFTQIVDDVAENEAAFTRIKTNEPLFFNINAGFTTEEAANQLSKFLRERFPTPIYLESNLVFLNDDDHTMFNTYQKLMNLPVIAVTSFAEGVCPMVRSLQLALPDHGGVVVPVVARHETGGKTLADVRAALYHGYKNGMPTIACAFNDRVHVVRSPPAVPSDVGGEALVQIVEAALAERATDSTSPSVVLPSVCGLEGLEGVGAVRIRALVMDGRTDTKTLTSDAALRRALAVPGQTLALEDFDLVLMGEAAHEDTREDDGENKTAKRVQDAVLVLSRQAADAKSVHWIEGAAESDLLVSYPVPFPSYEDLDAEIRFVTD